MYMKNVKICIKVDIITFIWINFNHVFRNGKYLQNVYIQKYKIYVKNSGKIY